MAAYYGTGPGFPIADPALMGITKSFGGGESSTFNSGNRLKSGMDPVSLGLGIAGIGSSLIGGFGANRTAASIAGAQLAAADAARRDAIILGREQGKLQLAGNIGSNVWGSVLGPDLEKTRQFEAMGQMLGPFAEKETAIGSDRARRERFARISPESKEAARFEAELNRRNQIASQVAQGAAMFGPTSFSSRFTG